MEINYTIYTIVLLTPSPFYHNRHKIMILLIKEKEALQKEKDRQSATQEP